MVDVRSLRALVEAKLSLAVLLSHSATFKSCAEVNASSKITRVRAKELKLHLPKHVLSASVAEKIAKAGLTFADLCLAQSMKGKNGVRLLLTEQTKGRRVQVTKSARIIHTPSDYFANPDQAVLNGKEAPSPIELSEEKLALFQKQKQEGHDLPDTEYSRWLASTRN